MIISSYLFLCSVFDHILLPLPAPSDHLHLSTNPAASSSRSCSHKKENKKEKMKANKQTKNKTYQTKTKPKAHPEKHGAHCVLVNHSWHGPCPRVFDMPSVIPWRRLISSFPAIPLRIASWLEGGLCVHSNLFRVFIRLELVQILWMMLHSLWFHMHHISRWSHSVVSNIPLQAHKHSYCGFFHFIHSRVSWWPGIISLHRQLA